MLVLVTLLEDAPVAGKCEHVVVPGSALYCQRWRKCQAAAETGFLCLRLVNSLVVESPWTLSFCVSRKRVTDRDLRKTLVGALWGMIPSLSWNCISFAHYSADLI